MAAGAVEWVDGVQDVGTCEDEMTTTVTETFEYDGEGRVTKHVIVIEDGGAVMPTPPVTVQYVPYAYPPVPAQS